MDDDPEPPIPGACVALLVAIAVAWIGVSTIAIVVLVTRAFTRYLLG